MNQFRRVAALRTLLLIFLTAFLGGCVKHAGAIRTLDDAKNSRIGVTTGSIGEAIAKARYPQAQIKSFDDVMDAVAAQKSGQLDAIIAAYPTLFHIAKKNPELMLLSDALDREPAAIAVRKDNPELLAAVNQAIAELEADGTLAAMKKRWFKEDLSPYEEPAIEVPREGKPLRIAVSATREPLSFVDKDGRVTGHDGELARRIAAKLHRPIEFSNMKWMALIAALQSGKADMILTGMTMTDERKKFVAFSQPYFDNAQMMLVRKPGEAVTAAAGKLVSPADLGNKRIGVLLGSAQDVYANKTYSGAKILQYHTASDIALGVKTGKVDAALYDEEELQDILREDPSLAMLGGSLFNSPVGVGFHKSSAELRDNFNRFLAQIKQNGVYADMVNRWIQKREAKMPEIQHGATDGAIVVGTSVGGPPFGFVKDGETLGFDIEMAKRFGAFIHKDVKFSDMEFGGLVASVASKKVDMIAASIFITDERKKLIDFSDPYYEEATRVFALKSNIAGYAEEAAAKHTSGSFFARTAQSFRSNIIEEKRYLLIWDGLKTTVLISILATVFGTLLGAVICFLRMSKARLLNAPARLYIALLRGTPVLVVLMLIFYVVFASVNISPVLVAVIAFGMNFAAYVSELFRTGIEGIDPGQMEAGVAMGFSRVQTFLYVVLPQMLRRILPVYKGEFISLVKMTSVVGYIAVQDLTKASDIVRSRTFDAFFPLIMVAALYFTISWLLMQSLEHLERVTDPKFRRAKAGLA